MFRATLCIVCCGAGAFENVGLGNVFAADEDDWDVTNKTFMFVDQDSRFNFRSDTRDFDVSSNFRTR